MTQTNGVSSYPSAQEAQQELQYLEIAIFDEEISPACKLCIRGWMSRKRLPRTIHQDALMVTHTSTISRTIAAEKFNSSYVNALHIANNETNVGNLSPELLSWNVTTCPAHGVCETDVQHLSTRLLQHDSVI
jgi:hypothetical protein